MISTNLWRYRMKMSRLVIQIPDPLKSKLNGLRATGTTASGLIRHLLNQYFQATSPKQKGG